MGSRPANVDGAGDREKEESSSRVVGRLRCLLAREAWPAHVSDQYSVVVKVPAHPDSVGTLKRRILMPSGLPKKYVRTHRACSLLVCSAFSVFAGSLEAGEPQPGVSGTFSIVAVEPETGVCGAA